MAATGMVPANKIAGYNQVAVPRMDPRTMEYRQGIMDRAQPGVYSGLDKYAQLAAGDESAYAALEKPAFENFNRLLGQIGSRYAGVGSGQMSARNSSAFQNETTGAAADLAGQLQEQRLGIQQNALKELFGISNELLGSSPYEYGLMPKKKKFLDMFGEMLGNLIGQAPGMFSFTKAL